MAKCAMCGKTTTFGNQISIAHGVTYRSKRQIKPNLQMRTLEVDGKQQRTQICTRCLRTETRKAHRIRQ